MYETDKSASIVVVDDEAEIREEVCEALEFGGFSAIGAESEDAFWRIVNSEPIGLVILDLMLPGSSGTDLSKAIRALSDVGIVIVTGRGDLTDAIVALELGADDFIQKPVHARELLARVKAVLRRAGPEHRLTRATEVESHHVSENNTKIVQFMEWKFDLDARGLVSPSGDAVELTTAEYDLLRLFVQRPKVARSREWLMDQLHGPTWVGYDRGVDGLVSRLRRKLITEDERCSSLFKSIRGVGYMFTASVESV